ncbi:uncharacterized protein LOC143034284 [Oratosquilla oratoria]|uniref:uncharacterized protein LOC143034284 n=1 Tax=Oratosquilla oratoria TaxID=337810 RepID=UPI003F75C996
MYGPSTVGPVPLRTKDGSTLLKDQNKTKTRWEEHFSELFNNNSPVDETIFGEIPQQPIHHDLADAPQLPEVAKSIKQLKYCKSAGPDGIPAEIYKGGSTSMANLILKLFTTIWTEEQLPNEWRDATFVTIFKKGDRSDCCNYRARQLQEKAREQYQQLSMTFFDLTKSFDSVNRSALWKILSHFGCPDKYINIMRLFHDNMQATILCNGDMTDPIEIRTGVNQGYTYRSDDTLFQINHLKETTKTTTTSVVELQYAGDTSVNSCTEEDFQIITTKIIVYKAVVIPTLLYDAEAWLYARHIKALEKFHQRCLRRLLGISWHDRRTNTSVLKEAHSQSIEAAITHHILRWAGHVNRMPDYRLPKQVLYAQMTYGKRSRGGQRKRYKDVIKRCLDHCNINTDSWEEASMIALNGELQSPMEFSV